MVGINALGQLVRFTGGGFQELASLPVYATSVEWSRAGTDYSTVANRGLVADGDLIYINLNALTEDGKFQMLPNFPGGVWCYDDNLNSLYHRYSATTNDFQVILGLDATVNSTNNNVTLTGGNLNNVTTGALVFYKDGSSTSIPELNNTTPYYLIKDSSTVFRLATSYANAIANTAIDFTGTGNSGQSWHILKVKDYGWFIDDDRKSIAVLNSSLYDTDVTGRIAFTADLFARTSRTTPKTVLCGISPHLPNRGYFITPKLESPQIEDTFQKLYIKHRPLKDEDKIIVKYKSKEVTNFPFSSVQGGNTFKWTATWTDTDTFTTTVDMSEVEVGDEIEIIAGVGSGHIAHVSSISLSTGTYTVNLDEAFPFAVASDVCYFMVDKWIVLGTIEPDEVNAGRKEFALNIPSEFIQFKIEMRGVGVTINQLLIEHARLENPL